MNDQALRQLLITLVVPDQGWRLVPSVAMVHSRGRRRHRRRWRCGDPAVVVVALWAGGEREANSTP